MTKNIELYREKRKELQELSKIAKMRIKADCEGMSVNEVLISEFYSDEENQEFKTLHDWNKSGFRVVKGSTAFIIWGKPKPLKKEEEANQSQNQEEEKDDFFPLCYLFSNAQVISEDAKK
jgi:hypothetical protein